jgi:very-short-patch-repair endonuclease
MDQLQSVAAYWLDCIKSESALEQNFLVNPAKFGIHNKMRATLFAGNFDPFIFNENNESFLLPHGTGRDLALKASVKGQELHYGYPLLMFYDHYAKANKVAPLFVIRLETIAQPDGELKLNRAETCPAVGNCAFEKLGLNQEEIVALNNEVGQIFEANKRSKLETILYLIKKETRITFVEGINPKKLSSGSMIHPYDGTVIYNKAVLYSSEASVFNLHLLNDLEQLAKRKDLRTTSLKYMISKTKSNYSDITPIMPFVFDEYQLLAIQAILKSDHTVVTGPPGTGKSQFIANLIINLFLLKKKVLFVSHTSDAVRVVNDRINHEFSNLMMETGRKENRQELGRRLDDMVRAYNDYQANDQPERERQIIDRNWKDLKRESNYLKKTNRLHKQTENRLSILQREKRRLQPISLFNNIWCQVKLFFLIFKLRNRRRNNIVVEDIKKLKTRHVELSRLYVKANYLDLIFKNEFYGQLLAYIDLIQHKNYRQEQGTDKSEKYLAAALKAMNVWSCTLKSLAANFPLKANLFDYVIFDEASQIDLPSAAPALYRAKSVVVVGDENQLTHIAKINNQLEEELAEKHKLNSLSIYPSLVRYTDVSLFNSAKRALSEPERELKNHYRSNSLIANLFSSVFYGSRLKIYEPETILPPDINPGAYWIDVSGTSYKYKSGSKYNPREAAYIVNLLKRLLPAAQKQNLTIGVATPYSKQQEFIAISVRKKFNSEQLAHVRVLTVHKFQGSEVDILLFSPVLAKKGDGNSDYWYIKNKQLLNVAVSRAKHLLLIVGDIEYALQSQSKLKEIAQYCNRLHEGNENEVPNRPMNIFEHKLLAVLKNVTPKSYKIEPQYVLNNRFTLDFALISKRRKIAIELDGRQHEIIGGLPVFEDGQRDKYLQNNGWKVIRITVSDLLKHQNRVIASIRNVTIVKR